MDIVLWDHTEKNEIIASPVSMVGMIGLARWMLRTKPADFLAGVTENNIIGCFPVQMAPQEFVSHFDPNIVIVFYDKANEQIKNIRSATKNHLQ